jgi:predicted metal-dependent peptidase
MRDDTLAASRIQKARTSLLLDHPFFGTLLFRLKGRETHSVETMATDGVSLFYNPQFVGTLNAAELAGVLAHEVMHPALQHHVRRQQRSPARWNIACDYAINPLLFDAGLTLPVGVLLDNCFRGMSAERIYSLLDTEENQQRGSELQGTEETDDGKMTPATPGGIGQVIDPPTTEASGRKQAAEQARDWQIAVEQAETLAKLAGRTPAGLGRSLEEAESAAVDWRAVLRTLWSECIPADYSWSHPNRRLLWSGLYLPGIVREGIGEIAIAVDCSGSINKRLLGLFEAEIRSLLEGQRPDRVHVLYFDSEVHKIETFEAGQPIRLEPVGGGGTEFSPVFEWLDQQGVTPQTLVVLTDLYGAFPADPPNFPVIWASTGSVSAPFGQVVPMVAA